MPRADHVVMQMRHCHDVPGRAPAKLSLAITTGRERGPLMRFASCGLSAVPGPVDARFRDFPSGLRLSQIEINDLQFEAQALRAMRYLCVGIQATNIRTEIRKADRVLLSRN
jgi:hypothetical protein